LDGNKKVLEILDENKDPPWNSDNMTVPRGKAIYLDLLTNTA
jgi:hypothetical protein